MFGRVGLTNQLLIELSGDGINVDACVKEEERGRERENKKKWEMWSPVCLKACVMHMGQKLAGVLRSNN